MTLRVIYFLIAATLSFGLPAQAQDTTTTTETTPETTTEPEATPKPATDEASTETETESATETATDEAPADNTAEIPAKPNDNDEKFPLPGSEVPREIVKASHGDWQVRCSAAQEDQCFLYQIIKDSEGRSIAEFTLINLPDGGQARAGATLVVPLGVLLTRGISLKIDSGKPLGYPFLYCSTSGCFARLGLSNATITRMKKGAKAAVTLYGVNQPEIAISGTLSLTGFTAAMKELGG